MMARTPKAPKVRAFHTLTVKYVDYFMEKGRMISFYEFTGSKRFAATRKAVAVLFNKKRSRLRGTLSVDNRQVWHVTWEKSGVRIGCMKFSSRATAELEKWAKGGK